MRLSEASVCSIKKTAEEVFGVDSEVYLFGSRINDDSKGGDIDLLVQTSDMSEILSKKLFFLATIKQRIGDQKIDLIVRPFGIPERRDLIYQEALKGLQL